MTEQIEMPDESMAPSGVGPQLRLAREKLGLSLEDVAKESRISKRNIEHIEAGEFSELPGRTYAFGFSRTYAKIVQLDQDDVVAMVRAELGSHSPYDAERRETFEPGDPARAPSSKLVWFSVIAVVILLAGLFMVARLLFSPAAELPSLVEQQQAQQAAAQAAAAPGEQQAEAAPTPSGPVVFTAQGEAWVRFYDADGRILQEKTMQEGETYSVPADANGPQIITGRPDLLAITVGGQAVPKLSEELVTISDVPISAEALLARTGTASTTSTAASAPEAASQTPAAR